jgi:phosphomevalonate kinase
LADVAGGSESPSLARTVLAWKDSQSKSAATNAKIPHWDDLKEWNGKIATLLQELSCMRMNLNNDDTSKHNDEQLLQLLISQPATEWKHKLAQVQGDNNKNDQHVLLLTRLLDLRHATIQARFHLKAMGQAASGVPIEPESQTALADATANLPGVITALVPGAGGYDALCCLYINHATVQQGIGQLWSNWKHSGSDSTSSSSSTMVICPLGVQAVNYGQGVRVEAASPI